jgi:hypothetical protein
MKNSNGTIGNRTRDLPTCIVCLKQVVVVVAAAALAIVVVVYSLQL